MKKKYINFLWDKKLSKKKHLLSLCSEIIFLRGTKGISERKAIEKMNITQHDYRVLKKKCKIFKEQMKKASDQALLWWIEEFGRRSLNKSCDVKGLTHFLKMEFDYDVEGGNNQDKETFNVTYTVRAKVE